jgi:hypothetical protein
MTIYGTFWNLFARKYSYLSIDLYLTRIRNKFCESKSVCSKTYSQEAVYQDKVIRFATQQVITIGFHPNF